MNLSQEDEALAKQALLIGRVIDERKDAFARGDFLIHNIIGLVGPRPRWRRLARETAPLPLLWHAR